MVLVLKPLMLTESWLLFFLNAIIDFNLLNKRKINYGKETFHSSPFKYFHPEIDGSCNVGSKINRGSYWGDLGSETYFVKY